MKQAILLTMMFLPGALLAQQGPGFDLSEHAFNAGATPEAGADLTSASFRITLGAIGQTVTATALQSASFGMDGGFVAAYPPPGEVADLRFDDATTLAWSAERSAGFYQLYQGTIANLFDATYGACQQSEIAGEAATVTTAPAVGQALFFLVTVENRLGEEGTKGTDSEGSERANPQPCQ